MHNIILHSHFHDGLVFNNTPLDTFSKLLLINISWKIHGVSI